MGSQELCHFFSDQKSILNAKYMWLLCCAMMKRNEEKATYHNETVANPKTGPSRRTIWNAY